MATFELQLQPVVQHKRRKKAAVMPTTLDDDVLRENARWFVRLRWGVVAVMLLMQAVAVLFPAAGKQLDIIPPAVWPLAIALVLFAANLMFSILGRPDQKTGARLSPVANIWSQILLDLACLTVVVHLIGSTSFAAFLYVIHIALACIFFPARHSMIVTLFALSLYGSLVSLEQAGILPTRSLFNVPAALAEGRWPHALQAIAIMVLLLIVWYMVSRLSEIIREGEQELMAADAELRRTQEERDRFAMETTHQLKSPLDAVRSSISLIQEGYLGNVPQPLEEVFERIDRRCTEMSALILDVLRLSRLKNTRPEEGATGVVHLEQLTDRIITDLTPSAERRGVTFVHDMAPCTVPGAEKEIWMMLNNLVSNAVNYSRDGGTVTVSCRKADSYALITIADTGIGIPEAKLSSVFDEYYRTPEAVEHNPSSSGIGLAIVKHVAERYRIKITIDSEVGIGTTFRLQYPTCASVLTEPQDRRAAKKMQAGDTSG